MLVRLPAPLEYNTVDSLNRFESRCSSKTRRVGPRKRGRINPNPRAGFRRWFYMGCFPIRSDCDGPWLPRGSCRSRELTVWPSASVSQSCFRKSCSGCTGSSLRCGLASRNCLRFFRPSDRSGLVWHCLPAVWPMPCFITSTGPPRGFCNTTGVRSLSHGRRSVAEPSTITAVPATPHCSWRVQTCPPCSMKTLTRSSSMWRVVARC